MTRKTRVRGKVWGSWLDKLFSRGGSRHYAGVFGFREAKPKNRRRRRAGRVVYRVRRH